MNKLFAPVTAKDHAEGPANAPVAFVEYGDYQCPTCGQAFSIVQRLQKHFGDKLRFVFHTFPLPMHPYAEHAAETAEFAAAHDKFWPMHDLLFKHQSNLADEELLRLAEQLGLSSDALAKHSPQERTVLVFKGMSKAARNPGLPEHSCSISMAHRRLKLPVVADTSLCHVPIGPSRCGAFA